MHGNQKYSDQFRTRFLKVWRECSSSRQVALAMDIPRTQVRALAAHWRNQGYDLKQHKNMPMSTLFDIDPEPCKDATVFCPGSPEKIEVLRLRASRNETLFHPRDAGFESSINRVQPRIDKQYVYKYLAS
jgi:hypothetical protein